MKNLQLQKFYTPTLLMYLCKNLKYNIKIIEFKKMLKGDD